MNYDGAAVTMPKGKEEFLNSFDVITFGLSKSKFYFNHGNASGVAISVKCQRYAQINPKNDTVFPKINYMIVMLEYRMFLFVLIWFIRPLYLHHKNLSLHILFTTVFIFPFC